MQGSVTATIRGSANAIMADLHVHLRLNEIVPKVHGVN